MRWRSVVVVVACVGVPGILWLASASLRTLRPLGALPPPPGRLLQREARDWGRIVDPGTGCVLINNVWNRGASDSRFEQEVFVASAEGRQIPGWRWRAPWRAFPVVVSQPQIVCGDKPWDDPARLVPGFPFDAGSRRLSVDFEVRLAATGTYNMVFTMWVVDSIPATRAGITHEIMIWNATGGLSPAGRQSGVLDVGGRRFELYVDRRHPDNSHANDGRWTYVAYVGRPALLTGRLELTAFIDDLLRRGLLSRQHKVTSVEFGNEVAEGVGSAELRRFDLRLE